MEEKWHKVIVGDIIKMENNQFVAVSYYSCQKSNQFFTKFNQLLFGPVLARLYEIRRRAVVVN